MFSTMNESSVGRNSALFYDCPCGCGEDVDTTVLKRHKCTSGKHGDNNSLFGGFCLFDPESGWNGMCLKCGSEASEQKNWYLYILPIIISPFVILIYFVYF
jgi:hypothetical protein